MGDAKKPKRSWVRRLLIGLAVLVALILIGVVITGVAMNEPRPEGRTGPDAEAHAHLLLTAVNGDAWDRTGAVRWVFAGRNEHLWDKQRHYARVRWDDVEVLLRLGDQSGIVHVGGRRVGGDAAREHRETAYAHWVNDSFWLNPVAKIFDEGTTRALVTEPRGDALLLSYASGGLTPGDAYLWIGDPSEPPRAWKMWVSILPVGGVECSWDRWQTLSTGAKVSTLHDCGFFTLELTDVAGAVDVTALEGDDPFAALAGF